MEAGLAQHRFEIVGHRLAVRVALRSIALERPQHDRVQRRRDVGPQRRRRPHLHLEHVVQRLELALAAEQAAPGQHLPEHDAEPEQIDASVERFVLDPFRRDVRELALEKPLLGVLGVLAGGLGDAEVQQLHAARAQAHDVGRADVATAKTAYRSVASAASSNKHR